MITELSTPETQARSFSLFAFTGALAIVLAPIAGGYLVNPADKFGFLDISLFRTYPYLLPPLVSGIFGGIICLLCSAFIQETRPWGKDDTDAEPETVTHHGIMASPGVKGAFLANLLVYTLSTSNVTRKSVVALVRSIANAGCLQFCQCFAIPE